MIGKGYMKVKGLPKSKILAQGNYSFRVGKGYTSIQGWQRVPKGPRLAKVP